MSVMSTGSFPGGIGRGVAARPALSDFSLRTGSKSPHDLSKTGLNEAGKVTTVPDTVNAVRQGKADAGVMYYSAAIAAGKDVDIVRFPESVSMSEAIRNAAVVPGTARNVADATKFVGFLLSPEAQSILKETGQPPVVPAIRKGAVPAEVK